MARGWESKAVESQQADAGPAREGRGERRDPAERARERRREELGLARARVLGQLPAAVQPVHRRMLEAALAALDQQLAELS